MSKQTGLFHQLFAMANDGAILVGLVFAIALSAGCAPATAKKSYITTCELPSDQLGSLLGKWRSTPIPIAFQDGAFAPTEKQEIMKAIDTWNDFYATTLGIPTLVDYGDPSKPETSPVQRVDTSIACTQNITTANAYTGRIIIYKNATWNYPSMPNVMAFTTRCRTPGSPLPYFFNSSIEINYRDFFVAGKKIPDLQTIVLHELGHLLGLDHSCESGGRNGIPSCQSQGLPSAYSQAVMFPTFGFDLSGYGIRKRELGDNDQGRANCLYMNPGTQ